MFTIESGPLLLKIHQPVVEAFFRSFVVLPVGIGVVWLMRRSSAAVRHLIWLATVVGVLLLPLLSAILPGWRILPLAHGSDKVSGEIREVSFANSPVTPTSVLPPPATSEIKRRLDPAGVMLLVWISGVVICLAVPVLGHLSLWRLRRASQVIEDEPWRQLLRETLASLRCYRSVLLLKSNRRQIPMVWGAIRPRLLLPAEADNWPLEHRKTVLLHELAHVKRWDYVTSLMAQLACALYWPNPLIWVAARGMTRERERACDDLILNHGVEAKTYATDLLQVATGGPGPRAAIAMARPSQLEQRIVAILDHHMNRDGVTRRRAVVVSVLASLLLLPIAMLRERAVAQGQAGLRPEALEMDQTGRDLAETLQVLSQLKELRHAEHELANASALYRDHVISKSTFNAARRKVELIKAELGNDADAILRMKLEGAQEELDQASQLWKEGVINEATFRVAQAKVDLLKEQLAANPAERRGLESFAIHRIALQQAQHEFTNTLLLYKEHVVPESVFREAQRKLDQTKAMVEQIGAVVVRAKLRFAEEELESLRKRRAEGLIDEKALKQSELAVKALQIQTLSTNLHIARTAVQALAAARNEGFIPEEALQKATQMVERLERQLKDLQPVR